MFPPLDRVPSQMIGSGHDHFLQYQKTVSKNMNATELKRQAAHYAVNKFIHTNMVVGLGVGSTAIHAIHEIGRQLQSGQLTNIVGIPCGAGTEQAAHDVGIPLSNLEAHPHIDVTIDGADEVDPKLNLIKGGGGALLREKIVAQASAKEIIVVDESKQVPVLGTHFFLPIEVNPFGMGAELAYLPTIGGQPSLRKLEDGSPFVTDGGHYILDTQFGEIPDPAALAAKLDIRAAIVEHGLFIGLATTVVVASADGIREITA